MKHARLLIFSHLRVDVAILPLQIQNINGEFNIASLPALVSYSKKIDFTNK
jgi:hypothetical protein